MIKIANSVTAHELRTAQLVLRPDSAGKLTIMKSRFGTPPPSAIVIVTADEPTQYSDTLKSALRKVYKEFAQGAKDADNQVLYAEQSAQEARIQRSKCEDVVSEIENILGADGAKDIASV